MRLGRSMADDLAQVIDNAAPHGEQPVISALAERKRNGANVLFVRFGMGLPEKTNTVCNACILQDGLDSVSRRCHCVGIRHQQRIADFGRSKRLREIAQRAGTKENFLKR